MSAEVGRLRAAQTVADDVIRMVATAPDSGLLLQVSVTDPVTGQRLATGFVSYQVDGVVSGRWLHLIGADEHERPQPKLPLPRRPRGPHPHAAGVVS
ncbi:hypothetical protein ACIQNU_04185 [Streptomyces sp. NPDC091292]|uniref:hypothetical protein n=1 Tax=Streptomyces sp. NPDC091292 TaxID=3365991 RepID=UPI003806DE0C